MCSNQRTLRYTQHIEGTPGQVFPLLCPNRECDWLDGCDYEIIYSESGFVEANCVFKTRMHGDEETYWVVSRYESQNLRIEFVRFTIPEVITKIAIQVIVLTNYITEVKISYTYTVLSKAQLRYFENRLERNFEDSMVWWEKSMNHYLNTGKILKWD